MPWGCVGACGRCGARTQDVAQETAAPDALAGHSVDEDLHDPAARCTNAQLAWLGLLRGLAGFYTTELRLLVHVAASEELAASYKASLQQDTWKAAVREMRGVMAEVRAAAFVPSVLSV